MTPPFLLVKLCYAFRIYEYGPRGVRVWAGYHVAMYIGEKCKHNLIKMHLQPNDIAVMKWQVRHKDMFVMSPACMEKHKYEVKNYRGICNWCLVIQREYSVLTKSGPANLAFFLLWGM